MTGTSVRRAAGSLWGVRGRRQRGGGSGRGGRRAPGSPCGARGRHVWRRQAAPRSPAGRGTGRAGVRGAGVARVVVVSVVVARPVVRHTRPTADCRPAASGPSVSRSAACACSPCGDPQTSGGFLTLRWFLTLGWLQTLRWSLALRWPLALGGFLTLRWWLPSGGWPRSGEWRLGWASLSRLSRRGSARRGVPAGRVATRSVSRPSGAPGVRPAASGPSVSRSSSCACAPCGDPLDIGRVTYIWIGLCLAGDGNRSKELGWYNFLGYDITHAWPTSARDRRATNATS